MNQSAIRLGVVGAASRMAAFKSAIENIDLLRVQAVCDTREEKLEEAQASFGAPEKCASFDDMIACRHRRRAAGHPDALPRATRHRRPRQASAFADANPPNMDECFT